MEVITTVMGWMFSIYFIGYIGFSVVWYAWDWYQWIVYKKKDHKFPITANKSWQIHATFSLVWPVILYGYIVGIVLKIFRK